MEARAGALELEVAELMSMGRESLAAERLLAAHPADAAESLMRLDAGARRRVVMLLPRREMARMIAALGSADRRVLIAEMTPQHAAAVLDEADDDVAAEALREQPRERAEAIVRSMASAAAVAPLLAQAEDTAGARMTRAFVALGEGTLVADAIAYLRRALRGDVYGRDLYVVDGASRLRGVLSLRDLIIAEPDASVDAVMWPRVISVHDDADQEEVARLVQHYDLVALPVVDAQDRLIGVVTVDDVLDVLSEEATEDFLKFAGVGVDERALSPLLESARRRLPWLGVNMVVALCAAVVVNQFDHTIAQVAALAVFMPVIAGQGGNAGVQTATIVVRGLALGDIGRRDVLRVMAKEVALGAVKGAVFGLALGLIALAWKQNTTLAALAGVAMFLNMIIAGTGGVLIPMTLRYGLRVDPATAAGVFDTMLTDIMGFFIFLGLATLFIDQLAGS